MLENTFKSIAVATALGWGAMAAAAPASAETYRTSCYGDDCMRLQCDDWGRDCVRLGYFDRYASPAAAPDEYYTQSYREYPDSYYGPPPPDPDDDYDSDNGLYYHYRNHFDPDNDYDEYPD
ncbi:MAG TPA: hypothetical protein VHY79_19655 [Rhizomicrobium sp.]|jgi:hypothetical protein|nr:hypothetical protein [Rhizomicrobium sp.]